MFQFPASPTPGQTFNPVAGVTYRWNGTAWFLLAGPGSFITTTEADVRYVNIDEAQNVTNRIINGKFAIDQRNAGAAVTANASVASGIMTVDRWFASSPVGVLTIQRGVLSGGANDLQVVVQTVDTTIGANDFYNIAQRIEGFNVADLNPGTASASSFTYAFDVSSSVVGLFSVAFRNADGTRSYVAPYTVTTPSVYQTVVITVPGETSGVWNVTNGNGMSITHSLAMDPAFITPNVNTWLSAHFIAATGQVNFMATVGNTYRIRNVRLYKGSVDFGPDRRLYAEELALCQRYYCKSYNQATVPGTISAEGRMGVITTAGAGVAGYFVPIAFPASMRATPTITGYSNETGASGMWRAGAADVPVLGTETGQGSTIMYNNAVVAAASFFGGHWTASAEL